MCVKRRTNQRWAREAYAYEYKKYIYIYIYVIYIIFFLCVASPQLPSRCPHHMMMMFIFREYESQIRDLSNFWVDRAATQRYS